jgi:hypothetical protein
MRSRLIRIKQKNSGTKKHVLQPLKEAILRFCNGSEKTAALGMNGPALLQLETVIFKPYHGLGKMVALGLH